MTHEQVALPLTWTRSFQQSAKRISPGQGFTDVLKGSQLASFWMEESTFKSDPFDRDQEDQQSQALHIPAVESVDPQS